MTHGEKLARDLRAGLAITIIFAIISYIAGWGLDDTDTPSGSLRSGMRLYTDYRTGCQYVGTYGFGGGSLTPRLDGAGKQMGCRYVD